MVKELVVYPDDRIVLCTNVRDFKDESLPRLLQDMKDTMEANNLNALAAIQIAHPFNIVVIKQKDGSYLELINPSILQKEGKFISTEKTSYFPDIELKVPRYEKIKLIYEDRDGNLKSMLVEDKELSATIQRKLDYLGGGTPLDRLTQDQRDRIKEALASKGLVQQEEVCPVFSKKDYIKSFVDKLLFFMALSLFTPLFKKIFDLKQSTVENIYLYDKIAFPSILILMVGYFIYAQYEAKKYRQCSSCQIGNQIGIILKRVVLAVVFAIASYFLVNPN